MKLISIVAASENNVIGIDNKMPWHLPDDLKFFKRTTLGSPIIMGKNTWASLGAKALPGRSNIIISRSMEQDQDGAKVFPGIETALAFLDTEDRKKDQAFIIGGGQLYKATMDLIDEMYITRIHTNIDNGSVFFPEFNDEDWNCIWSEKHEADERHKYPFTFQHWTKK